MPCRKEQFVNGEIYHIISRGIDDNTIFSDTDDYYRGIFSIYEFNNSNPVNIFNRRQQRIIEKKKQKFCEVGPHKIPEEDKRDKLVEILAFCFMPNHIHLLLRQIKDNGIMKFMAKFGTGFGGYHNHKYNRKGYVFQNRFKDIHIEGDNQLRVIFTYIHTNPIALIKPKWKELGIKNSKKAINFLNNYKWSSYRDYIGQKSFPSVTERDFLTDFMRDKNGCQEAIRDWVEYKEELAKYPKILLD